MSGDMLADAAIPMLLPQHQKMIADSAISEDVARARGYRSAVTKAELRRCGFNSEQSQLVPALIIPSYRPNGEPGVIQIRPDRPRYDKKGKPRKYEMPDGDHLTLDVPPTVRHNIVNPKVPLFVTEGMRKGDALASKDTCVVTLLGVTGFRGTNAYGGKTSLVDFNDVALNDREIYIVFDSDVMIKQSVYAALCSIRDWLASRGGEGHHPNVYLIYLPPGEGGVKQGVDDYLAAGHTLDDLMRLATTELRQPPGQEESETAIYQATPGGLVWNKPGRDGATPVPLTNFQARIVADVLADDGQETEHEWRIEARRRERTVTFTLPAASFEAMRWPAEHLGTSAGVFPGMAAREHAAWAIRQLSGEVPQTTIYTHTGWRQRESGRWIYLHAGGAIGAEAGDNIAVRLSGALARYELPEPPQGEALRQAVRATLDLLKLGPDTVIYPMMATIFRAILGPADYALCLTGRTGSFKSELTALMMQHYGKGMNRMNLPASWSSSDNALEDLAFVAKDALLAIDDFVPVGPDAGRLHTKADRVLRAQGNGSGRQRMRRDGVLRAPRVPRGLMVSTGEEIPNGQSLRARLFTIEIQPTDILAEQLTVCQQAGRDGLYAACMAGFLAWMAPQYPDVQQCLPHWQETLRLRLTDNIRHRRTPSILADLLIGLKEFVRFAIAAKAVGEHEARDMEDRGAEAIQRTGAGQTALLNDTEPTSRFIELLRAALVAGRAHVADRDGFHPDQPKRWGWRARIFGRGENERTEQDPQGERIGFVDGSDLYLVPDPTYAVVMHLARETGDGFTLSPTTLWKRFAESGLLRTTDQHTKRQTIPVRRKLGGGNKSVLHFAAEAIVCTEPDIPDIPDTETSF